MYVYSFFIYFLTDFPSTKSIKRCAMICFCLSLDIVRRPQNLKKSPTFFEIYLVTSKKREIFSNYFSLLITSELKELDFSYSILFMIWNFCCLSTAKRKLERLKFSTSSSFVKIWSASSCEFKVYFWTFWAIYHLLFDLETIGVN